MGEGHAVYEPTTYSYDEVFPALPESSTTDMQQSSLGQWNERMKVNSSIITQVFSVPVEERRFKEINEQFGGTGEQAKICAEIMEKTGAHIEISSAKDQSLAILVTGKQAAVLEARRQIVNLLQTQANLHISIPKEHHRFILGKSGKRLQALELSTATKITVPRPDENSDMIKIVGTKENIDKARHEIQIISDEQAKLGFERLVIPKIYHPFISGPYGDQLNQLSAETGARINIPPPSFMKNEITIAGDKEGVMKAKDFITKIYEEKNRKCQMVQVNVRKSQHKYIVGPKGNGIQEILGQTGVSVEIPPTDCPSDIITLRGEQDKLGPALTLVYAKASSVIDASVTAPSWLHKYIIGRKGANIRVLTQDFPKVHVEFDDHENKITIEGPPGEVEQAHKKIEEMTSDLVNRLCYEEIHVDPKYHKHIIGKNGANVNRIKQETGVLINIPSNENSDIIRIEGDIHGVAQAKQDLLEMTMKMENEKTKDIVINQAFHRTIIGAKGESIKEIRDKFNQVNIAFPDPGTKSDTVTIRGPKQDVDMCYKYLQQVSNELMEKSHRIEVPIYKQFHKYIIGKGGANIKRIRDETGTKIDLPAEGSESDVIVITGKKSDVEVARDQILKIQNELANIVNVDIIIPAKFHNSIIGAKGRLIRSIMEECGGVSIHFPKEGTGSDKVTIRGPKEDVDKAKKQLLELTNEKQLSSFTGEIRAKPEHHKFLIGRNGANIRKVRDKTGARIIFPSDKDEDRELISIIGKKEAVQQAKAELEALVKDLDKVVECEIRINPKYHRHFVARRGEVLRNIADECGGVTVSFPRSGLQSDVVTLKGAKDFVEAAKQRIGEIVADLEQMVTIECIIPQKDHRTVMGSKGIKVQSITQDYDVQIKFPDRETRDTYEDNQQNGEFVQLNGDEPLNEADFGDGDKPKKTDIIKITGKYENCEKAKQALLALVPIAVDVEVPNDFHRWIIGPKGRDVRELMERYDVNIAVPPVNLHSDIITIKGPPACVENAKVALAEKVEQLEKEKQEKELRKFRLRVEVDPKHHPKIIGRKGAVITKIRQDHDVQVQFPDRLDADTAITITGYEKNAEAARDAILEFVSKLENMVSESVRIDRRVHSRLIGSRGRNIRKIMDQYEVEIRFPRETDEDPNLVVISGLEDNVQEAKDYLLNLEEEYLQDVTESEFIRQYTMAPSRQLDEDNRPSGTESQGFVVKGGPWEQKAPDTSSSTEFPSFGASSEVSSKPVIWGPKPARIH